MRKGIFLWGKTSISSIYCSTEIMDADFYIEILRNQLPEVKEMLGRNWR